MARELPLSRQAWRLLPRPVALRAPRRAPRLDAWILARPVVCLESACARQAPAAAPTRRKGRLRALGGAPRCTCCRRWPRWLRLRGRLRRARPWRAAPGSRPIVAWLRPPGLLAANARSPGSACGSRPRTPRGTGVRLRPGPRSGTPPVSGATPAKARRPWLPERASRAGAARPPGNGAPHRPVARNRAQPRDSPPPAAPRAPMRESIRWSIHPPADAPVHERRQGPVQVEPAGEPSGSSPAPVSLLSQVKRARARSGRAPEAGAGPFGLHGPVPSHPIQRAPCRLDRNPTSFASPCPRAHCALGPATPERPAVLSRRQPEGAGPTQRGARSRGSRNLECGPDGDRVGASLPEPPGLLEKGYPAPGLWRAHGGRFGHCLAAI
jgi:hypothetical protein